MNLEKLVCKGYEIRKIKTWTDEKGRTHTKSVGGWYGNLFLSIGMPIIITLFIVLIFLIVNPLSIFFVIPVMLLFDILYFISSIIYDYKMKHIWTEENGWKTTSLPKVPDGFKRFFYREYNGFKLIREMNKSLDTHRWYAHNTWSGEHIEYPEITDFSVNQMNICLDYLKKQIDKL